MLYGMTDQAIISRWSVVELKQLIAEVRAEIKYLEAGYGLNQAPPRQPNPMFDHAFFRVRSR